MKTRLRSVSYRQRVLFLVLSAGALLLCVQTLYAIQPSPGDSASEPSTNGLRFHDASGLKRSLGAPYVKGRLIVKYKDSVTECVHCLLKTRRALKSATSDQNDSLDLLHAKYRVQAARPVFRTETEEMTIPGPKTLSALRQLQQNQLQAVRRRFATRAQRARKGIVPPDVSHIYRLEMADDADVESAAEEFAQDPHVEYAEPDYRNEAVGLPNDTYVDSSPQDGMWSTGAWGQSYEDLWGLKKIAAVPAWNTTQGQGVVVAVLDSGLDYTHPDIAANVWTNPREIPNNGIDDDANGFIDDVRGWDFTTCEDFGRDRCDVPKARDNDPMDGNGHGTHVSGTIAAAANNGLGIAGVAPQARIMAVKGLNDQGSGSSSDLATALRYLADNGADVVNNSWGGTPNETVSVGVEYAYAHGVVVLASAGNNSTDALDQSPANVPVVIPVSAFTQEDTLADFSNFGSIIDVAGPGGGIYNQFGGGRKDVRNILSLKSSHISPTSSLNDLVVGTNYLRLAGTSMSCPHASGVAALIIGAHPSYSTEDVRSAIRLGADDVDLPGRDLYSGFGRLNANRSITLSPHIAISLWPATRVLPKPGSTGMLTLVLENVWLPTTNVRATLASPDLRIRIESPVQTIGSLSQRQSMTISYRLTVDSSVPFGAALPLTLALTADGGFQIQFNLQAVTLPFELQPGIWPVAPMSLLGASSPVLVNLDGQPGLEILVSSGDGIYALHHDGTPVSWWPFRFAKEHAIPISSPAVGDLDGDGTPEVVAANDSTQELFVLSATGQPRPPWPLQTGGYLFSSPVLRDLDGDRLPEILIGADQGNGGKVHAWHADGTPMAGLWPIEVVGSVSSTPAVGDLDGDGMPEILATTILGSTPGQGKVYAWHADGSPVAGWPVTLMAGTESSPALANLDSDPQLEVVVSDNSMRVYAFKANGALLPGWPVRKDEFYEAGLEYSSPTVADVDGDKRPDIVVGGVLSKVHVWRSDGSPLPGWPRPTSGGLFGAVLSSPLVADLDGDGNRDVIAMSVSNDVYAWHHDGTPFIGMPYRASGAPFSEATPAIGDLDGDGDVELIVCPLGGPIQAWDFHYPWNPEKVEWGMFHHDPSHTGNYHALRHAPVLSFIGGQTTSEGQRLEFRIKATDLDGDLQGSIQALGVPAGAEFMPLGDLDGDGVVTQQDVLLLFRHTTLGGGILTPAQQDLADLNGDGKLANGDVTILNAIALHQTRVSRLRWTPTYAQAGSYPMTFTVTDAGGARVAQQKALTVTNVPLTIPSLSDSPDPFSPNGDLTKDTTRISGSFNHTVTSGKLQVKNAAGGVVRTFTYSGPRTSVSQIWDGKDASGIRVPDGSCTYILTGTDVGGSSASRSGTATIDTLTPMLSALSDSPDPFRPSLGQNTTISFTLSEPSYVTLQIYSSMGTLVRTLLSSSLRTTLTNSIVWNGRNGSGVLVPAGTYTYKLWVTDPAGNRATPYPASGTITVQ